jgi:outer membrane protein assembly factor BamB
MFHRDTSHTGYSTATGPSTNQTLWVFNTNGWVLSSPAVANGIVYFTSSDKGYFHTSNNNIYAVNAKDGSKIWNYSVSAKIYTSPAVADGMVFFGSDNKAIYALNATTGAYIWTLCGVK